VYLLLDKNILKAGFTQACMSVILYPDLFRTSPLWKRSTLSNKNPSQEQWFSLQQKNTFVHPAQMRNCLPYSIISIF